MEKKKNSDRKYNVDIPASFTLMASVGRYASITTKMLLRI